MTAWNARSSHAESVSRDSEHREFGREKHSIGAAHRAKERGSVRARGGSVRGKAPRTSRSRPGRSKILTRKVQLCSVRHGAMAEGKLRFAPLAVRFGRRDRAWRINARRLLARMCTRRPTLCLIRRRRLHTVQQIVRNGQNGAQFSISLRRSFFSSRPKMSVRWALRGASLDLVGSGA